MSDKIEQAIKEAGADVAPRITLSDIHGKIEKMDYIHHGLLTICVLTLQNGFTVTGESACASPENYNQTVGETIAYENAVEKIWPLEGYLLKQRLYESALTAPMVKPMGEDSRLQELNFGMALSRLRAGQKLQRDGWNGKGLWVELQKPDAHSKMTMPYIYLNYPDDQRVPWAPSQTDVLANDWRVVA